MTCVVALTEGDRLVMGADSGASHLPEYEMYTVSMPKVFRAGPWLVGFSGSYRLGQILKFNMPWPEPPGELDYEFMATKMTRALHECLSSQFDSGYPESAVNRQWQILIGRRGKVYGMNYRYDVINVTDPFTAIGSGRKVALGALHGLVDRRDLTLFERVERALLAAAKFVPGLGQPFVIESSPPTDTNDPEGFSGSLESHIAPR